MEWYETLIVIVIFLAGLSAIGYGIGICFKIKKDTIIIPFNGLAFVHTPTPPKIDSLFTSNGAYELARSDYENLTVGKEFNWIDFNNWLNS